MLNQRLEGVPSRQSMYKILKSRSQVMQDHMLKPSKMPDIPDLMGWANDINKQHNGLRRFNLQGELEEYRDGYWKRVLINPKKPKITVEIFEEKELL